MNKKSKIIRLKHRKNRARLKAVGNVIEVGPKFSAIAELTVNMAVDFLQDLQSIDLNRFAKISEENAGNCLRITVSVPDTCEFLLRSSLESGFLRKWNEYFVYVKG